MFRHAAIATVVLFLGVARAPAADTTLPRASYSPPTTIDRTGRTDVTADLQGFIASVPDGSQVDLPKNARYRIDGTVTLTDRNDLLVDGHGTTLAAGVEGDRNRAHVRIVGGSAIHIRNLKVLGANAKAGIRPDAYRPDRVGQQGFDLHGVDGVELDRVTVSRVFGDTVYVGRSEDGTWSSEVWVHDSVLDGTGRHGITVTAGRDVVVERNFIGDIRYSTFDLEPNSPSWGARDIYIAHNTIGPGRLLFLSAHGAGPVDNVVVLENRLQGHPLSISVLPPPGDRRAGYFVVGNQSDTPYGRTPLTFERLDGLTVRYNTQPVTAARAATGEVGVEATDVCGLEVAGNDFGEKTDALREAGPQCAEQPSQPVPPPPAIAARDHPADPPDTLPTGTTDPYGTPTTSPDDGSSDRPSVDPTVALLALGIAAITLTCLALAMRQLKNSARPGPD